MVLITNQQGDVKTGTQGEAVYQGRYGRQVRRTRQPKRGQVSKAQNARRLLFKQALDWRRRLSRHDRLVLEQYAYQAHYTDDHHITFTWDRMAMTIALQVPTLAILE